MRTLLSDLAAELRLAFRREGQFRRGATALALVLVGVVGSADAAQRVVRPAGPGSPERFVAPMLEGLPMVSLATPGSELTVEFPAVEPLSRRRLIAKLGWHSCGFGYLTRSMEEWEVAERVDPVALLAQSFRGCTAVRLTRFVPTMSAGDVPTEGWLAFLPSRELIAGQVEFFDEAAISAMFRLATELPERPEPRMAYVEFYEKVGDYRSARKFAPELLIEFAATPSVTVEISFTTRTVLIQTADRWEVYELDGVAAAALQALVEAKVSPTLVI